MPFDDNTLLLIDKIHVGDCLSVMGSMSLDVCGVQGECIRWRKTQY